MKRQKPDMPTRADSDKAAYLAECARLYAQWKEICAEALAETPPEERKYALANIAAAEMQI